ncbi:MAG: CocE/NonD family hydrolase [Gammaproteobacteria bacterium]
MRYVDDFPREIRKLDPVWITLGDGCQLAATVWLPIDADADPVPAILEYLPYRRRDFTALGNSTVHPYLAGHGYAAVRVDARGCGDSDGLMLGEYLARELEDGVEVIAWLSRQPWCSGNVGLFGISWGGFNALQIAALRPPALKAVISACSTDDRYADDIHYMGGCLINENLMWASTMFGFNARPPDPAVVGDRWREMWLHRLDRACEPWIVEWLSHQRRDAFWRHGSVCERYEDIECAVYMVGGWADGYTNAIPRALAGLSCPRKGLIGPWSHAWGNAAKPGPTIGWLQEALRWWDHWLKGVATGVMDEPMLRAWMQDSVPPAPQYEVRPGRWVAENAWPSPLIAQRVLTLGTGTLDAQPGPGQTLTHASPQTTGLYAGEWCPYGYAAEMPIDQRHEDGMALSFSTAALPEHLEMLGAPVLEAEIAVDRPVAFLAAWLCDVAPDGASTRISYGLLNLTRRNGHDRTDPLVPGERYNVRLQLNDLAQSVPAGHRLRLALATDYWPIAWPSPAPVTLTLVAGRSRLLLPERAKRDEDAALAPFDAPEGSHPMPHTVAQPYARSRSVSRDIETGTTIIEAVKDRGRIHLHEPDLWYAGRGTERYEIRDGEPLAAKAETHYAIAIERGRWRTRTETHTVMSATDDEFLITATLDAYEGDVRIFARSYDARIPRDGT